MKIFYLHTLVSKIINEVIFELYRFQNDTYEHGFIIKTIYPDTTNIEVYNNFLMSDNVGYCTNFALSNNIDLSLTEDESEEFTIFNSKHRHGHDLTRYKYNVLLDYTKEKFYKLNNIKHFSPGDLVKLVYSQEDVRAIELAYSTGVVTNSPLKKFGSNLDSIFTFIDTLSREKTKALIELKGEFINKEFIVSTDYLVKI